MTSSEIIVTGLIWALTAAGGFFSIRGVLRRRRQRRFASRTENRTG